MPHGRTPAHVVFIDEEKQRLRVFRDHLKYVLESKPAKSYERFQLELNEFADWTLDEFNSLKKGLVRLVEPATTSVFASTTWTKIQFVEAWINSTSIITNCDARNGMPSNADTKTSMPIDEA